MSEQQPLVVTLAIDDRAQRRFDDERARLFPPGRTQVGAHITLFHAIPGGMYNRALADLRAEVGAPFDVHVPEVMPLGRGAAYRVVSPELHRRHRALQQLWWTELTRQDQQGFRPHVTVQNKVSSDEARATVAGLRAAFEPFDVQAEGFVLWRYDSGPWTRLLDIPFT